MKGELPARLTFALAALITFYRGTEIRDGALIGRRGDEEYRIQDGQSILEAFAVCGQSFDGTSWGNPQTDRSGAAAGRLVGQRFTAASGHVSRGGEIYRNPY